MDPGICLKFTPEAMRDQVQRVFMLGTVSNRVDRAVSSFRVFFQPAFELDKQLTFARGWRAIEEEHTAADIGAQGRRFEVLNHPRQGIFNAKQLVFEKGVMFLAGLINVRSRLVDHVVNAGVGTLSQFGIVQHHRQILPKGAFPGFCPVGLEMGINLLEDTHSGLDL